MQRLFTLEEARKALPLVRRIAADLHNCVEQLSAIQGGLSFIYGAMKLDEFADAQRSEIETIRLRIDALGEELREIGVELKGLQPVLVDFRALRAREEVYLCWAYDEETITHWHSLDEGFKARRPL
ncbi:DUF2203 domain-containing protein [candidate division KSB1 bacterium]|nr:DUF2203 domain-containing protein [candidate division KSB1 bacterium]